MQQKKKKVKIDAKLMKKYKKNCGMCGHFEEVETEHSESPIGICTAFEVKGGHMTARGARSDAKWCGVAGTRFIPKGTKKKGRQFLSVEQEEPKLIEDMTLEELDEIVTDGLKPADKARITKQRNKLNKEQ